MEILEDYYLIAEISSVFDGDGYIKVKSFSDFPDRFFHLDKISINIYGHHREFIVEDVERIENNFILKFKNFDSDIDVEFLVGSAIFVKKNELVALEDDTFFIHDLIGCKVFFNEKFFGKIVDVLSLRSNDVYVIENDEKYERLIPAVAEFIQSVNIEEKIVLLKLDYDELSDENWYHNGGSRFIG